MKLIPKKQQRGYISTERRIHIRRDNYRFYLNAQLLQDLGLKGDERIIIAKDEDSRNDWYFAITTEDGAKIRICHINKNGDPVSAVFYCKAAANEILNSVNAMNAATFIVAAKATMMPDGRTWYRIMTAIPKNTK